MLKVLEDIEVKETAVSIAAAITSLSRMRIWELIDAIESKGYKVYYCDTDSSISNCDIHSHPDLMERFKWDGTGKDLGSLKDESEEVAEKYFTKKIRKSNKYKDTQKLTKEHKEEINSLCKSQTNRYFDSGVIAGLKFYSLQKKLHNGESVEINKLKGGNASKLCHKDNLVNAEESSHTFECLNGCVCNTIHQKTIQFKCGMSGYMNEDSPFAIKLNKDLPKKFTYSYSKALTQRNSNFLTPICA